MKKNLILLIVSFALFMEAVDTTVLNTAIPVIAKSLDVNPINLKIALISYLVSLAIFIPISGWIADKFGAKKVFVFAVVLFTASSVWCGFTNTLPELIIARIMQGVGGSLTLPVGRLIIIRTCERHELISKMNVVVMVAAIGMMLGPVLGGVISNHFSWRWIFWVNAPVGIFAFILGLFLLPSMPPKPVAALDKWGFILFGSGLALLTIGLSILSESDAAHFLVVICLPLAISLLALYAWHSYKRSHPIVKIELLRIRTFRVSILGNLFARLGFGGFPFLLPLLLQVGLGYNPQVSGLLLAPTALGVLIVKPLSVYILRCFGYKKLLILNTILVGVALGMFALIDAQTSFFAIALLTFVYGLLISLQYTGMNSLAYANIDAEEMSAATSIVSTTQQLAQSFGVAAAALLIRVSAIFSEEPMLSVRSFHQTFIAMSLLTFASIVIFIQLKKEDGHELIDIPARTATV
ncbi:multidrug efflux protein [Legionella birminghamensis]|uniref:Multidrug efflux protein n=1 Tax=Legionella birminghamensis TaxID=28083 RepID=A0A378I6Q9_9GAMM|nr:DHA2 family efflux MFS transporter permease subunit [Legionella birminghamensis]KTC70261.1 multidrug efflux protein [Legionella birminghamensis]STX30331.1 multidrug efflux protein [Legionella birminghamensis]